MHEWKGFVSKDALSENLITWVFEEDSFSPIAKVKGNKYYSILADHLGTPIEAFDDTGKQIWNRELNSNGKTIKETNTGFCNFTFQGQSYDAEIELAYNRFRYYDVEDGRYISQDPIGLLGGITFYTYPHDTNEWVDPFGLKTYRKKNGQFGKKPGRKGKNAKKKELDRLRQKGVKKAWKAERKLVKETGQGTRRWTEAEMDELLTTGKVSGYQGHHINSVKAHPELADNPNNIKFVTPEEHLAEHGGDFHNTTTGDLIIR